jgi:hypothetical protein
MAPIDDLAQDSRSSAAPHGRRTGAVTLELLLALPVLIIAIIAIVQFGLFFTNMQQVALACRVGAEEASQTPGLPHSGDVPANVVSIILKQLENSCIAPCAIILEHNQGGMEHTLRCDFDNDGDLLPDCPDCEPPASPIPLSTARVTICIALTELIPNCLAAWGFDISDEVVHCSATFALE